MESFTCKPTAKFRSESHMAWQCEDVQNGAHGARAHYESADDPLVSLILIGQRFIGIVRVITKLIAARRISVTNPRLLFWFQLGSNEGPKNQ